jgi:hypothetical protein
MNVTRRGTGCGSLVCARRFAREAQVQAAPRRGGYPETAVEQTCKAPRIAVKLAQTA